jgi:hypothetical protein
VWLGDLVQAVLYAVVDRDANFTAPIMQKVRSVGGRGWRNCARFMISHKASLCTNDSSTGISMRKGNSFSSGCKKYLQDAYVFVAKKVLNALNHQYKALFWKI